MQLKKDPAHDCGGQLALVPNEHHLKNGGFEFVGGGSLTPRPRGRRRPQSKSAIQIPSPIPNQANSRGGGGGHDAMMMVPGNTGLSGPIA